MKQLKELRLSIGLSWKEFVKQFGSTERTIAHWNNGETDTLLSIAVKLAKFYDVSMDVYK